MTRPFYLTCENLGWQPKGESYWAGFQDVSFSLKPGALVVIQGSNGTGKSSLLKILANQLSPSSGALSYGDLAVKEGEDKPIKPLFINESGSAQLKLKVAKQLRIYAKQCDNLDTLKAASHYFQLAEVENTKCYNLSAGYKQKLLLTQLLFSSSKLWLLDDPFHALDEEGASLLQALIQTRTEQGGCVVMSVRNTIANPKLAVLNMDDFQSSSV